MTAKYERKYEQWYKDMGKGVPPGVLVEENKRRKIVKELGGEMRGDKGPALEEEKKNDGEEVSAADRVAMVS